MRWTCAMTEWRTQLLCSADVLWHACPAFSNAVVGGGMGAAVGWLGCSLSVWPVPGGV